jgi:epoxyqueuosine reductase QueG
MNADLKAELRAHLLHLGAYDVGVADPSRPFEHGIDGRQPRDVWPECRSVVVAVVARAARMNNTYFRFPRSRPDDGRLGQIPNNVFSPEHVVHRLSTLVTSYVLHGALDWLRDRGIKARGGRGVQQKLCAVEAGLGVYGRSGIVLHPVLGNRMAIVTLLLGTRLPPDGRLNGPWPCENCRACINACPAGAYDPDVPYPEGWSRRKCLAKRGELMAREGVYCHNCFAVCPAGTMTEDELLWIGEADTATPR